MAASLETLAPPDPNVRLPASVMRAAEAAARIHQEAYKTTPSPQPDPAPQPQPQPDPTPQPDPVVASPSPQPDPQPDPQPEPPQPEPDENSHSWKHRFLSMQGRWQQSQRTIGEMQETMAQMGDELQRRVTPPDPQPQRQPAPQPTIRRVTEQDLQTYSPELVDLMRRAALEAVEPLVNTVRQDVQQTRKVVGQDRQKVFYADLDAALPDWRAINKNPRFVEWCRKPDVYSGVVRGQLLNAAVKAADAPRAVAFFKGFLDEERATGHAPNPQAGQQQTPAPRQAAVALETLAAPGKAKPAAGSTQAGADKPIYTHAQIRWFYSQEGRRYYAGKEAERKADEADVFAAQREGRVR